MQASMPTPAPRFVRALVLGGAVLAAMLVAAMLQKPPALRVPVVAVVVQAQAAETATPGAQAPGKAAPDAAGKADGDAADATDEDSATVQGGHHGIVIEKGGKKIRIEGLGRDREYDSFEQFMHDAPWLAGMFFIATMAVFLVPLLIVALLVWYKLRKNRLANETMLKLAERGVVPPATAMDAVASGNAPAMAAAVEPTADPAYNNARALRRRAVWSDLRKGVILAAIGVGLNFWSMLDDGTANGFGLILLFLGLGYCVLWFFEDRNTEPRGTP
ncbi:MAG TPA: DUF6249 domain-containing protein [Casimicrobiaceae bacterium]|jgi:hypothetical protein|nr:DUF6249 domain-containing protein [Casimicrobiaceae bacterium]